jgi:WhiB family transcriptional regulator, redox-sensing transcriptional regulator
MEGNRSLPELEWRERASCLAYPAILFFGVDDAETPAERRIREDEAKRICSTCEVRTECLEYALATKEPYGIWGGLTELERKARLHGRAS